MRYKALICDVDGTLVPNNPYGMPSLRVKKAIAKAKRKIHIGIATARAYSQVYSVIENLDLSGPCIILGGAQILDPITKKIFSEKILKSEDIKILTKIAEEQKISLKVSDSDSEILITNKYMPCKPLDIYTEKLSFKQGEEFLQKISHIPTISAYKVPGWGDYSKIHIVITHPEATKQHGILEIAKILKISTQEIIGIGEGYNDFPLLISCGLKIAMGNAVNDVKKIADYIAPTVENDGVADVIEKFVLRQY